MKKLSYVEIVQKARQLTFDLPVTEDVEECAQFTELYLVEDLDLVINALVKDMEEGVFTDDSDEELHQFLERHKITYK